MPQVTLQQAMVIAIRHRNAGRSAQAEEICRQILERLPNHPEATYLLGHLALTNRQFAVASELLSRGAAMLPDVPQLHYELGLALAGQGKDEDAIAAYRTAIQLKSGFIEAVNSLGAALMRRGEFEEALACLTSVAELCPGQFEAQNNLGIALAERGRYQQAAGALSQAVRHRPDSSVAHRNLGKVLARLQRHDEAIAALKAAVRLQPDDAEGLCDLGVAMVGVGAQEEAIKAFEMAIQIQPDFATARWFHSMALLIKGDFQRGFEEYEWRWMAKGFTSPRREFSEPQWTGTDIRGRTILLHCEQGFGDSIQFVRYAERVAALGAKVLLECPAELFRLFSRAGGIHQTCPVGHPLPPFDLHCPLLSLPAIFKTTLASIPMAVPYLTPDPELIDQWRHRLGPSDGRLRVGLAWAGRPEFIGDHTRSLTLALLAPLAVPGVRFVSLQKGPAAKQTASPPPGMEISDLSADLQDFADTAAVISLVDLVITTDTSIPHLAGALGKPVWLMLQFAPDWRWLLDREDSPWYPTMRLFRQPSAGNWSQVVHRVGDLLTRMPV